MPTIEKRTTKNGDASYRVKIRVKGKPTVSATFARRTDAREWAKATEYEIKHGKYFKTAEAEKHTIAELVDRYLRDEAPKKRSEANRILHLNWWKEAIGDQTLADVTPAVVAENRDKLLAGKTVRETQRSPATVNRYLAALSHAFTIAMKDWGWVEENPILKVSKGKESKGRVRFLSDAERKRLLEACKNHSDTLYTIVVLAISTGARLGEILNLRWPDIDQQRGIIILNETKNDERRAIPLQGHALDLIEELSNVRRIDTDLLFPSRTNTDKPLAIHKIWEAALKKAEIQDFRFHDLRHSAASYLAMNGATLAEIADVLGHKTLQMVKRYTHLSEQHTTSVVAKMNKQIFG